MTDTIADFFSKDDEIKRLNAQINMMANFYDEFYKGRIKSLTVSLQTSVRTVYKYKYFAGMLEPTKNKELALELIINKRSGFLNITYKQIAEKTGYTVSRLKGINWELNCEKL
jgi:predicted GNAT superfamily acetyltransferase